MQVSCGTGPSLTGQGQVGLKGSPHSQGVPWKVPEVSVGCLVAYLVSTEGRGHRNVMASPTNHTKKRKSGRFLSYLNETRRERQGEAMEQNGKSPLPL